eukprot:TRINITY_DN8237_c4_g1_i1.p1 TRINITY_DN8237_c4_g1~~TRINITY_DN8237_c4_g1_i1.p1  ORF type:complete len:224 (-),score=-26.86 TRINITY_DN8237_c4_g1_i1:1307-1918(-)
MIRTLQINQHPHYSTSNYTVLCILLLLLHSKEQCVYFMVYLQRSKTISYIDSQLFTQKGHFVANRISQPRPTQNIWSYKILLKTIFFKSYITKFPSTTNQTKLRKILHYANYILSLYQQESPILCHETNTSHATTIYSYQLISTKIVNIFFFTENFFVSHLQKQQSPIQKNLQIFVRNGSQSPCCICLKCMLIIGVNNSSSHL